MPLLRLSKHAIMTLGH